MRGERYLEPDDLADALEECQANGNAPTERACKYFLLLAWKLMGSAKYRDYAWHVKEDMASAALEKCIKNIRNYRPEHRARCFSYYTRCVECAFFEWLKRNYSRHVNIRRELYEAAARKIGRRVEEWDDGQGGAGREDEGGD